VGRDPQRKLGWNDRLVGTLRMALKEGVQPRRYALGAAAALARLDPRIIQQPISPAELLLPLWQKEDPGLDLSESKAALALVDAACQVLRDWKQAGFPNLTDFASGGF
jgi:hypothetical protein